MASDRLRLLDVRQETPATPLVLDDFVDAIGNVLGTELSIPPVPLDALSKLNNPIRPICSISPSVRYRIGICLYFIIILHYVYLPSLSKKFDVWNYRYAPSGTKAIASISTLKPFASFTSTQLLAGLQVEKYLR